MYEKIADNGLLVICLIFRQNWKMLELKKKQKGLSLVEGMYLNK